MDSADATQAAYSFVEKFNEVILFPTIALLSAVALLVFIYGCFEYIVKSTDPAARADGVKHITYGIIGLVVMLSAYTILNIAAGTFGLQQSLDRANNGEEVIPTPTLDRDGGIGGGRNGGIGGDRNGGIGGN